jgi:aspartate/methionine/tyrosine aminotransferase
VKAPNALLAATGTTIFTVMSALAVEHGAINLGQGFPDTDGIEADPNGEVVVTSGATEAITACLMALLNPGDEVVLIEPLYDTYLPVVKLLGAVPRLVRLSPPEWALPRAELAAAFGPRTKALLINSPMNPTGKVFSEGELGFIADLLQQHDAYAICDEVYEHLIFDGVRHIPLMTLPGMRERCLRVGSAGKTFSLTGWKVGYITAPRPLATVATKAHQNLTFTTAPNLQRAVAVGLAKDDSYFRGLAADQQAKRDRLAEGLRRLGFTVLPTSGSYFITADFSPLFPRGFNGTDADFCRTLTTEAKVTAIPVSAFYESEPPRTYARFAFCKRPDVLDAALARIAEWIGRRRAAAA